METVRGGTQTGGRKRTVEDRFYAWRESNRCTTCVRRKNDPALAQQVMAKVESFIMKDQATLPPGRIYSCVVVLDENGEIAHAAGSSGGGWKHIRAYGRRTAPVRGGAGGKEKKA